MSYSLMLNKVISNTNYSQKEIVELCKSKYGIKISKEYFNRLLNNKCPPPREEISRAIAKVCNADERLLIIEGYIDKAPEEILEFFYKLKKFSINEIVRIFLENKIDKKMINEIKKEAEKEPISNGIINILDAKDNILTINNDKIVIDMGENIIFNINDSEKISVTDNAMSPLIQLNDNIRLLMKNTYNNGEIVAIRKNGSDEILIRQLYNYGSYYIFTAINKEYNQMTIKNTDVIILGRVSKIIKSI